MKTFLVRTLGCKANLYDSQLLEAELRRKGWSAATGKDRTPVDLCIVNSCTVTDEADRQTRKLASRLYRDHPGAKVVVTGCAAEVDPERLAASQGIHYVIGNHEKHRLVERVLEWMEGGKGAPASRPGGPQSPAELGSRHAMDREWPLPEEVFATPPVDPEAGSATTRAFLKIQEGCNSFCTYCVIPYGRGPSRSLRAEEVVAQVRELVARGVREVVLTGTNIGDYEEPLDLLLSKILDGTRLERLRVSSLDPVQISDGILELMRRDSRLCPHFHVSLQSTRPRLLRLMKRSYGADDIRSCLERVAELPAPPGGVFVGMDLITGFPEETEEEFDACVRDLGALPWTRLHVFPYSERQGTPALRLAGGVSPSERIRRSRALQQLSLERHLARTKPLLVPGPDGLAPVLRHVLLEKPVRWRGKVLRGGYTPNYLRIFLEEGREPTSQVGLTRNRLVNVRPIRVEEEPSTGEVCVIAQLYASEGIVAKTL